MVQIMKAEQQLLGFVHGRNGYSLISLIESMGLTKLEWKKINNGYTTSYLSKSDIIQINDYFKKSNS